MRSIELLVRTYPEKTCAEIMQIVEQEKQAEEKRINKFLQKEIKMVEDFNKNGAYFKGTFGLNQYFYYRFFNLRILDNKVYCDVEQITCFKDDLNIERRISEYKELDKYGHQIYERVSKEDFEKVSTYLDDMFSKFWTIIDINS